MKISQYNSYALGLGEILVYFASYWVILCHHKICAKKNKNIIQNIETIQVKMKNNICFASEL